MVVSSVTSSTHSAPSMVQMWTFNTFPAKIFSSCTNIGAFRLYSPTGLCLHLDKKKSPPLLLYRHFNDLPLGSRMALERGAVIYWIVTIFTHQASCCLFCCSGLRVERLNFHLWPGKGSYEVPCGDCSSVIFFMPHQYFAFFVLDSKYNMY